MLPRETKGTLQRLATAGVLLNQKIQSGSLGCISLGPGYPHHPPSPVTIRITAGGRLHCKRCAMVTTEGRRPLAHPPPLHCRLH